MGYTHYLRHESDAKPIDDRVWNAFQAAVTKILDAAASSGIDLDAHIDADYIDVNGVGVDSHENLLIFRVPRPFTFCKTAEKPYDTVVVAILCVLGLLVPDYHITSDGDRPEWAAGAKLASIAAGCNISIPCTIREPAIIC